MTKPTTLTQAEIARTLRAAMQVGARVVVEVEQGKLRIVVNETQKPVERRREIVL